MEAIIFDFDGVIIDSLGIKSEAFVHIYSPFGKEIVEKVVDYHEKNGGISRYQKIKYCHKKFLNIQITEKELIKLVSDFSDFVMSRISICPFVDGLMTFLEQKKDKYKMFIS
ncbi:MAG: HAD hydrolase-like protein, partial [Bacteroidota bacterium]|nr:HAD hydrolase-like protein [Bacteroidota bacterium]